MEIPLVILFIGVILPYPAPLIAFLTGCWLWKKPFARARWRVVAWYYGLLVSCVAIGLTADYFSSSVLGGMTAIFGFLLWCAGVALALLIPNRFRAVFLPGRCSKCEYDLTGNTSGICPECGQPIPRW